MTQIVTVSASTAAYAVEPLRANARVSGSSPTEATIKALAEKTKKTGDSQQRALMNLVHPPALALFFLTAGQQDRNPQTTLQMAKEEYALFAGEAQAAEASEEIEEIQERDEFDEAIADDGDDTSDPLPGLAELDEAVEGL